MRRTAEVVSLSSSKNSDFVNLFELEDESYKAYNNVIDILCVLQLITAANDWKNKSFLVQIL